MQRIFFLFYLKRTAQGHVLVTCLILNSVQILNHSNIEELCLIILFDELSSVHLLHSKDCIYFIHGTFISSLDKKCEADNRKYSYIIPP